MTINLVHSAVAAGFKGLSEEIKKKPCLQSRANAAEIIRGEKSLTCANFLPPLQNKIIKRMVVYVCVCVCETKPRDPHGAWVSASCHEYSCGVSHDKTQKVVLSPCLSRYTLVTAAVCVCASACVTFLCFCAGMLSRCLPCQLLAWHLLSCS